MAIWARGKSTEINQSIGLSRFFGSTAQVSGTDGSGNQQQYPDKRGCALVAFGNTWRDVSGNNIVNNSLTLNGSPLIGPASPGGPSIAGNGAYWTVPLPALFNTVSWTEYTIGMWINANNTTQQGIISTGATPTTGSPELLVVWGNATNKISVYNSNQLYTSLPSKTCNNWFHFILSNTSAYGGGSYTNQLFTAYINGCAVATGIKEQLTNFTNNLYLFSGFPSQFTGSLSNITIIPRRITADKAREWCLWESSNGKSIAYYTPRTKVFSAAPTTFTGSASLTTGAATASGSATFTKPACTATSTVTIAAATCSASGTFTKPVYSATSSVTIAAATCSATGTFVAPVYTATSVITVGAATASGAATFVVPVYTASASVAVGATVVNVAGSVVSPTYTGTAAVSVGAAVASGTASNNFVAGPYRVAARQVFVPRAVAFQVRTTGASAAQVF